MKKIIKLLFFVICFPCIVYSQEWKQYSDSIYQIIKVKFDQNGLDNANKYIQLADKDIEKINSNKDTIYADYLYRKGYVKYNIGQFTPELFEESLSIWKESNKKNNMKIMKIYYFLGAGYHLKLDYPKAYENYEMCYSINKKNKFPFNNNFANSMYFLSVIDYNTNLNFKKAEQYSIEYIQYNKENDILNLNFNYPYAYKWMDDSLGYEKAFLELKKSYEDRNINDKPLYFKINYELLLHYYYQDNSKEVIKYGEKTLELSHFSQLKTDKYLKDLYEMLVWAYSQIKDEANRIKYEDLLKK
jgi:hypothetical protein